MTGWAEVLAAVLAAVAVVLAAAAVAPAAMSPARSLRPSAAGRRHGWAGRRLLRRRVVEPDDVSVAAWCDRVIGGLRAGSSLTRAVADAGDEPGSPFADVAHAVRRGRPLAAAVRDEPGGPGTAVGLAGPVVAVCADVGGATTVALERVTTTLLARAAERDERRTASAQAALSARVLTLLPLGVLGLLVVAEPSIRSTLVSPLGASCVVAGVTLEVAGWWWMRRLIGRPR
jgi:Flp pilus assembly protein TadB